MKPQTMTEATFFNRLCRELDIDPTVNDEDNIIYAIQELKQNLTATEMALEIEHREVESLERQIDSLEVEIDRLEDGR